jgi:hypothetical protein|tara:strand:+ start:851 stop:1036 length:186 start_codon:yes stop_codon:yes gene_type:complete
MTNSEIVELIAEKTASEIKNSVKQIITRNLKLPWQLDDNDFNNVDPAELKRLYELLHNHTI